MARNIFCLAKPSIPAVGNNPASYAMDTGVLSEGGGGIVAWGRSSPHLVSMIRMSGAIPPTPYKLFVVIPHRQNFLTPNIIITLKFNPYLYYLHNFNRNYIILIVMAHLNKFVRFILVIITPP